MQMTKVRYGTLFLLLAFPALLGADPLPSDTVSQHVTRQVVQADENRQIARFAVQLAAKDPAQFATLVLGRKQHYVDNPNVVYIGIQGTEDAVVICKIPDTDVGTFYHILRKSGARITTQESTTLPATQDFITLFSAQ
jgi:hypothetical protein